MEHVPGHLDALCPVLVNHRDGAQAGQSVELPVHGGDLEAGQHMTAVHPGAYPQAHVQKLPDAVHRLPLWVAVHPVAGMGGHDAVILFHTGDQTVQLLVGGTEVGGIVITDGHAVGPGLHGLPHQGLHLNNLILGGRAVAVQAQHLGTDLL